MELLTSVFSTFDSELGVDDSEEEEEVRDPIDLEIFSINQIGEVQILFSELLESLETVGKGKLTTQSISNSVVFDIRYLCQID